MKEWIPIYGIFVVPEECNRTANRAIAFGIYHGTFIVLILDKLFNCF